MVAFNTVKAGDFLFDRHKEKMGNTTISRVGEWKVRVIEVDREKRRAMCSWNGNAARWWSEEGLKKLKRNSADKPTVERRDA